MYNLFLIQLFFSKTTYTFFYSKLGITIISIVALNKIKLNLIILILISLISLYSLNSNKTLALALTLAYLVNSSYFNFLESFLFGLFKIHPAMFYLSLIMYGYNVFTRCTALKCLNITLLFLSIISLILGGVWALYQLNWGFYWSTDPIELSLAGIILLYIGKIHNLKMKTYYDHLLLYSVLLYIQLIRSNVIYTKHNFFNNSSSFFLFIKLIVSLLLFNTITSRFVIKYLLIQCGKNLTVFTLCVFVFFLNFSYNLYVKLHITQFTFITLYYTSIQIEWNKIHLPILHATTLLIMLLFIQYKTQYVYAFSIKIKENTKNIINFVKSYANIWFKHKLHAKTLLNSKILKNGNTITTMNYNSVYLKKKLINYYV